MHARYNVHMFLLLASALAASPADVAIVPGCPATEEGGVSHCQQRRIAWVSRLWADGRVANVITSGAAVYNPFVEADVMADALIALGIPAAHVLRERDALHTDENIAWSLAIAEQRGFDDILVATDAIQAGEGCAMVRAWSDARCTPTPIDYPLVSRDLKTGAFRLVGLLATPISSWLPLAEREEAIATERGAAPRPASLLLYARNALGGRTAPPPALPPLHLRTPAQ